MKKFLPLAFVLTIICAIAYGQTLQFGTPNLSNFVTTGQIETIQNSVAVAQVSANVAQNTAASAQSAVTILANNLPLSDYIGTYTLGTLPPAGANVGKRILVSDLGGGPGYLRSSGGCWKRVATTTASVQVLGVSPSLIVDGLSMSPIIALAGSAFASKATVTLTNACSMPQITIVTPTGVFGTLGSLGLTIPGGSAVSVSGIGLTGTWNDYAVSSDGLTLTKIRGGSL
jgi:hypothetical protein